MMNGMYADPSVAQIEDDLKTRDVFVWKKDLEHSRRTESCADGAIYVVSADTVFVTKQSKECREKVKELKESQAAESVADRDKIRRREKSSEAPVTVSYTHLTLPTNREV